MTTPTAPLTLLPAATRPQKPWKNGGGVTSDVLVVPEGAGLNDFAARISIADVATSGPFSRFPGIDRSTAILDGAGFVLTIDGRAHRLGPDGDPLAYPGDVPAAAELLGGVTVDLNVMTRRGVAAHRLERVALAAGATRICSAGTVIVWQDGAGAVTSGAQMVQPAARDAVVLDALAILTARSAARFFVVSFTDMNAGAAEAAAT